MKVYVTRRSFTVIYLITFQELGTFFGRGILVTLQEGFEETVVQFDDVLNKDQPLMSIVRQGIED